MQISLKHAVLDASGNVPRRIRIWKTKRSVSFPNGKIARRSLTPADHPPLPQHYLRHPERHRQNSTRLVVPRLAACHSNQKTSFVLQCFAKRNMTAPSKVKPKALHRCPTRIFPVHDLRFTHITTPQNHRGMPRFKNPNY